MAKARKKTEKKHEKSSEGEQKRVPSPKGKGKGKKKRTEKTPPSSLKGKAKKPKIKAELKVVVPVKKSPRKKINTELAAEVVVSAFRCAASTLNVPKDGVFEQSDIHIDSQEPGGSGVITQPVRTTRQGKGSRMAKTKSLPLRRLLKSHHTRGCKSG